MPIQLSGSLVITGSITTTGGITISGSILSASYSDTASFSNNFRVLGDLTASTALVTGTLTAQTLVVQTVTSSIVYSSGSNLFGNQLSNTQTFTGSLNVTGSGPHAVFGNIGIGTLSPTTLLDVRGSSSTQGVAIGGGATSATVNHGLDTNGRYLTISGASGSANPNYGVLWLINNSSTETAGALMGGLLYGQAISGSKSGVNAGSKTGISSYTTGSGGSVGGYGGYMAFYTKPDNASSDIGSYERMRIDMNGNIGIGTNISTGTYGKLTVAGGIQITNDNNAKLEIGRYSSGTPNSYIKIGTNSNSLRVANAADSIDLVTITNGGQLLINTTSTGSYTNKFILNDAALATGSNGGWFFLDRSNSANSFGWYSTNNTAHLYNGSINIISATAAGVIGIGNGSYSAAIQFKTGGSTNYLGYITTDSNLDYLVLNGGSGTGYNNGGQIVLIGADRYGTSTAGQVIIAAGNAVNNTVYGHIAFETATIERMRIKYDGSVYIGGTSMPNGQKFGVIGSGVYDGGCIALQNTGTSGIVYTIFSTNSSFSQGAGNLLFYNTTSPLNNLILYGNGNYDFAGSDVSDRRLKQDIENINFGLNEIMQLSPKSYHLKSEDNLSGENITTLRKRYGFIAQEVQSILPDTITGTETETEYLGLDYNGVLAVAVKAIQELSAKVTALETK